MQINAVKLKNNLFPLLISMPSTPCPSTYALLQLCEDKAGGRSGRELENSLAERSHPP